MDAFKFSDKTKRSRFASWKRLDCIIFID